MTRKSFTEEIFRNCVKEIVELSEEYHDGWILHENDVKEESNSLYITKKTVINLPVPECKTPNLLIFEYHIAYHLSYGVPILAFNIWKQDGTFLTLEEFWKCNSLLKGDNMFQTLTQLDHPILQKPILTLHPCRTHEVIKPFIEHSKNPVVSWLSVIGHFVHLQMSHEYLKLC